MSRSGVELFELEEGNARERIGDVMHPVDDYKCSIIELRIRET